MFYFFAPKTFSRPLYWYAAYMRAKNNEKQKILFFSRHWIWWSLILLPLQVTLCRLEFDRGTKRCFINGSSFLQKLFCLGRILSGNSSEMGMLFLHFHPLASFSIIFYSSCVEGERKLPKEKLTDTLFTMNLPYSSKWRTGQVTRNA